MDWQLTFACAAVGIAGAYIVWRGWQTWRGMNGGCSSGGCGCAKKTDPTPQSTLTQDLTMRKGT